jgi:peptidoglycan/LPS O-acetylase OafA/YrhL
VLYANRPMTFLGVVSYSLYLWHYPMLSAMQQLGWMNGAHIAAWIVVLFAAIPAILFVSWLSYRYIEKPFLRAQATTPHVTTTATA